jgi:hypothetical protein
VRAGFSNGRIIARDRNVRHGLERAERFRRASVTTLHARRPHIRDTAKTVSIAKSGREQPKEDPRRDREAQERHDPGSCQ